MNYLLTGPEEYLKCRFIEKLKKSFFERNEDLNFDTFQAGTSEITGILDSFNTLPFISKHRLTVVNDIENFSSKEKNSILGYLKSPVSSTTLVLSSSLKDFNKFLEDVSRLTKVVACNRLKPEELNVWIRKEFAARHKKISPALAGLIAEKAGDDLFFLKNELDKLAAFAKDSAEITERHIDMMLLKGSYGTSFKLLDLVLEKRLKELFEALHGLLLKESPHAILGLLAWRFRNLSPGSGFAKPDLKKKLDIILEGDYLIKRGAMLPEDALERVLVKLCLDNADSRRCNADIRR